MRKSTILFVAVAATIILFAAGLSRARSQRRRAPADDKQEHLNVGGVDRSRESPRSGS